MHTIPKSEIQIIFADFASVCNIIKPYHLAKKHLFEYPFRISHPDFELFVPNKSFGLMVNGSFTQGIIQVCILSSVLAMLYTNDRIEKENTIFV